MVSTFDAIPLTGQALGLRLVSVGLLIAINAFFVTAEFAIVSVRRSRITQLVAAGDLQARMVQTLQNRMERLLSTTQIGITLSSLALGWIGEGTIALILRTMIHNLGIPWFSPWFLSHSLATPIAFFALAYLQIVLGELCPKSVALIYSEQLARMLAPPSLAIARFFNPFIWILNQSTRWLLRLGGVEYAGQAWYNRVTPEELQLIITTERESTGLEVEERELLKNVFAFGEVTAAEVMIPRTQLTAIDSTATFTDLINLVVSTEHSRYPLTGDSLDDIVGIIDFKDLAIPLAQNLLAPDTPIRPWVKPARFVAEGIPLNELLTLMQRSHLEMVMVMDEFGGTAGLVTLNDLIAEIIGDEQISDPNDELTIHTIDEQTSLVPAQLDLEEVNEMLGLDLPLTDEYQTLSGFVLYHFQKIPQEGEVLTYDNLELTVVTAEGPRLHTIRIYRHEPEPATEPDNDPLDD
ncbi:hemolysin family protein [Spirulina major CS-329]|nr:hemolysin family protein [Spirulina major]MDB9493545.1 hemolysin family protein [Spirulina subsalsa CS-330]MDB9503857.1 hemolysin family protein [Spirulina major CS-329]